MLVSSFPCKLSPTDCPHASCQSHPRKGIISNLDVSLETFRNKLIREVSREKGVCFFGFTLKIRVTIPPPKTISTKQGIDF